MTPGRTRRGVSEAFHREGFVIRRGVLDAAQVAELASGLAPFQDEHATNPLSQDGMHFASNVFRRDDTVARLLGGPAVVDLLISLGLRDAWVRWDQAVWKHPGAPEFPWHQDNGYTELSAEHIQVWFALSRMRRENGGLVVLPGGHRRLYQHRWENGHAKTDVAEHGTAIEADPGDVVVFSSFLPHMTEPNRTGSDRLAYVAEYLPLDEPDPEVEPPHLVVLEDGRPHFELRDLRPRWSGSSG